MDRKGRVVAVALIVVMMVSLFISCKLDSVPDPDSDPVHLLSKEDKLTLIAELLVVGGIELATNPPEDMGNFSTTFTYIPEEGFPELTYIKKGDTVTVKATPYSLSYTVTGKNVIGGTVTLLYSFGKDGILTSVKLNGQVILEAMW
jgi:hypothetical protein